MNHPGIDIKNRAVADKQSRGKHMHAATGPIWHTPHGTHLGQRQLYGEHLEAMSISKLLEKW